MRCTAAASPAAQTRPSGGIDAASTAGDERRRLAPRRRPRRTSRPCSAGGAGSVDPGVGLADLDEDLHLGRGRRRAASTVPMAGQRRLVAGEEERRRGGVDLVAPTRAGHGHHRRPAATDAAHDDSGPSPWSTTSTATAGSRGPFRAASAASGVSVRRIGRRPSASRNSLPVHVGMATSSAPGTRAAAGGRSHRAPEPPARSARARPR